MLVYFGFRVIELIFKKELSPRVIYISSAGSV